MWKDFFYFTRMERQGIIVLAVLIALVFTACWLVSSQEEVIVTDTGKFEKDYADFVASIEERKKKQNADYKNDFRERKVVLSPFDPNTTDSIGFLDLGLPSWMAKNILRYRAKGGKFRVPEEFKKIYGLTEEQYAILLPYIYINDASVKRDTVRLLARESQRDSTKVYKYPTGTVIDLNEADTTELKKIPGIGSGIARMIVGYRRQLGGFYDIEQLKEIQINTRELRPWLMIGKNKIQQLNLNKASIERLRAHPYINFYQAKVMVEYRKKKGSLKSLKQLALYEEFTEEDLKRISHYICFE